MHVSVEQLTLLLVNKAYVGWDSLCHEGFINANTSQPLLCIIVTCLMQD